MLAFSGIPDLQMEVGRQGGWLGLFDMLYSRNVVKKDEDFGARLPRFEF